MSIRRVKKTIAQNGMNITSLAKATGYTRSHISNVIHGHFKSPKAREAIANALNIESQKLWGKGKEA
ncbi:MAG: transcriptional regulator [Desulfobacteraceae bacterium]|nr:transcriptional regulator [Desulfobacteraceae bacterium]